MEIFGAKHMKVSSLVMNTGQIPGVPKNPRVLKDDKFHKLQQSILDDPEMLSLREMIVYQQGDKNIVLCGNMRLKVLRELVIPFDLVQRFANVETIKLSDDNSRIVSIDVKVIPAGFDAKKLRAISVKDNNSFGEWDFDLLANEWDTPELQDWGLDGLPTLSEFDGTGADKSGASPWDRIDTNGHETVVFSFGECHAKIPISIYERFAQAFKNSANKVQFIEGLI